MKESLLPDIFLHAGLFFALGSLVVPLLRYFKIPTALGYLLSGVLIGPYGLGSLTQTFPFLSSISLEDAEHVKILAELSIIFLLFMIGLELTPSRLWQMRNLVFGLGTTQVVVSASIIGVIAYLWGNSVQVSVLLGLSLALSSTAMVMQWLQEKNLFATPQGKTSFSILLLQDLAVIPILFLLTIFSAEHTGNIYSFISISLFKMVIAALAIYFIGRIVLKYVFFFTHKHGGPEVFVAFFLLIIVVSASAAHYSGLSMALGAFIAGLLLAETEYRHEVVSFIVPFKNLLLGIFFFSFGMGINLEYIVEKPFWLFMSIIGLMAIKASAIFILCKIWRQNNAVSLESAILLSQAGEFGLLVVGSALSLSLIAEDVGQFMLITVGLTMIATPIISPLARKLGRMAEQHDLKKDNKAPEKPEENNPHIVVFGYGRVGQNIGNKLCNEGFSIIGFDKNIQKVNKAKQKFYPVFFGNAINQSTLKAANFENALTVVIAIDDVNATKKIVGLVRKKNKTIPIVARLESNQNIDALEKFENIEIIYEDILISNELLERVLEQCTPLIKKPTLTP